MKPRPPLTTGIAALLGALPLLSQQPVEAVQPKQPSEPSEVEIRIAKLESWLRDKDQRRQWQGIRACVQMGRSAVPMLTRVLQESPRQGQPWPAPAAGRALVRLGPEALECLPAALKLLKDGNNNAQRKLALDVLGAVGPYDRDESEAHMRTVYDELRRQRDKRKRIETQLLVNCMVRLTEDPQVGIDELIQQLRGEDAVRREMALDWLAFRGKEAQRAVPAIKEVVTAKKQPRRTSFRFRGATWGWSGTTTIANEDRVRTKAALLLMKLGAGKNVPVRAHIQLVEHEDPAVRQRAVLELGSLGAEVGARGVRALQGAIFDQDKLVSWDAITALGMIGPAAKAAVPRLEALTLGQDKAKAARAEAALRRIQENQTEGKGR